MIDHRYDDSKKNKMSIKLENINILMKVSDQKFDIDIFFMIGHY